ncbi:MAG TPA: hypothetical protein VME44_09910 [Streptosporangiaceae bacterium]|nr:hypothetical protein [Streptosporangiaceae bacterium]
MTAYDAQPIRGVAMLRPRPAVSLDKRANGRRSITSPLSWRRMANSLRDPDIEHLVEAMAPAIASDAAQLEIDERTFRTQVRLHLPSIDRAELRSGDPARVYEAIRVPVIARCSIMKMSIDQAEQLAYTSLLLGQRKVRRDLVVERDGAQSAQLIFGPVQPSVGHYVQSRLHYLQSPRCDTILELGIHVPEAPMPIAYAGFSSCDRSYLRQAVAAVDSKIDMSNMIVLTRMYGLPSALPNLMSMLIAQSAQFLRSSGVRYIVTAFNPMLGFPGTVYRAAGFVPFAVAPVTYNYSDSGFYTSRRQSGDCLSQKLTTPENILLMLGVDRSAKRRLARLQDIVNITSRDYLTIDEHFTGHIAECRRVINPRLSGYRRLLESAWSTDTAHPSYAKDFADNPGPRGQCGVASVWLARELRSKFGIEATYCYGRLDVDIPGVQPVDHHCWIEVGRQSDPCRLVVDLTCDQAIGLGRETLCETHEDLIGRGLRYGALFRHRLDELKRDRVWFRFLELDDSVAEVQRGVRRRRLTPIVLRRSARSAGLI